MNKGPWLTLDPSKRLALACMELLAVDDDARRLFAAHYAKPTGKCELCGFFAPLTDIPDPRLHSEPRTVISACSWGCDFPCHGHPCAGCPACCPGLRTPEFWHRASINPLAWWAGWEGY